MCKNFKVPQESLMELIFLGHAAVQKDQGFGNLHVVLNESKKTFKFTIHR